MTELEGVLCEQEGGIVDPQRGHQRGLCTYPRGHDGEHSWERFDDEPPKGRRVAAALERRLRNAPEVARHVEDAVHVVEVLRRWYGPSIAKDVLRAALELAEVST